MQRLEVSGAVRPIYGSLGVKHLVNKKELMEGSIFNKSNKKLSFLISFLKCTLAWISFLALTNTESLRNVVGSLLF